MIQLLNYFLFSSGRHLTREQLTNFLYLADLYAVKWTAKQLTHLDWYCYWSKDGYYQLYSEELSATLDSLLKENVKQDYRVCYSQIPISIRFVLDSILQEWGSRKKFNQLMIYINSTAPLEELGAAPRLAKKQKINLLAERARLIKELGI